MKGYKGLVRMRSEEIHTGLSVQISATGGKVRALNGKIGKVRRVYGNPAYRAVEVAFADCSSELFWHYELEDADGTKGPAS